MGGPMVKSAYHSCGNLYYQLRQSGTHPYESDFWSYTNASIPNAQLKGLITGVKGLSLTHDNFTGTQYAEVNVVLTETIPITSHWDHLKWSWYEQSFRLQATVGLCSISPNMPTINQAVYTIYSKEAPFKGWEPAAEYLLKDP